MLRFRHFVIFALTAHAAFAEPPALTPPQPHTFRAKMALADLAALTVAVAGAPIADRIDWPHESAWNLAPGAIAFATLGPAVHALEGDPTGAAKSVGLRVGLPIGGALLAYAAFRCQGYNCYDGNNDQAYELLGAFAGAAAAILIDDVYLAHTPVAEQPTWSPVLAPVARGGGGSFGLARRW